MSGEAKDQFEPETKVVNLVSQVVDDDKSNELEVRSTDMDLSTQLVEEQSRDICPSSLLSSLYCLSFISQVVTRKKKRIK